ncbi:membrane protein insertase YidC [Clostridium sp. BJN0001]|uniref:membrane protein insertase YidC n=1 Tax=Clostridium sp. BJN0001 TaxID=2930219 RepID=UPI001FD467C0|nr:membrane protein insertase YidC [Clostridium sp. BJN0001]
MFNKIIDFMAQIFESLHSMIQEFGVSDIGASYVLAIFVFTLIVRIIILPFYIKSANSTKGMQKIQPQLVKIKEKYSDNPQKLQEETMKLYKDNNVSLTGGCLPMLLPFPILMALYYVFFRIDGINGASFLWIKDLGSADQWFILPVIAALSTYFPSYLMTKSQPSQAEGQPSMNMGMTNVIMSVVMGVMALNFKSILVLYWIIGNVIQLVQTYFLNYKPAMKEQKEIDKQVSEYEKAKPKKFEMTSDKPKNLASTKKKNKK